MDVRGVGAMQHAGHLPSCAGRCFTMIKIEGKGVPGTFMTEHGT